VFNYDTKYSVEVVNETEYNTCNSSHPLANYTGGSTVITLSKPGEMYFICPTPGLCVQGMKLAVNVVSNGGTPRSMPATADVKLRIFLVLATSMLAFMC
jgi:hypothetical protein